MSPVPQRLVLRHPVSRDDIDDAVFELGWQLTNIIPGSDSHPGQLIYATEDRQGVMYLVEDGRLGLLYFAGTGAGVEAELARLGERLPCHGDDDLPALLAGDDEPAAVRALGAMVLAAGEAPTDQQVSTMGGALTHASPTIRAAALVAATYAPWPALEPALRELGQADPDATIRGNAQRVVEALYR